MSTTDTRPYQRVIESIAAVWLIVAVAVTLLSAVAGPAADDGEQLSESPAINTVDLLLIAGVSGLIAIAATVPGWTILIPREIDLDSASSMSTRGKPAGNTEPSSHALAIERLGHAFLAGMLIRITGTIALFLTCSYYMDASPTRVGIWVLGWHLVLLLTEVIVLSHQIRET